MASGQRTMTRPYQRQPDHPPEVCMLSARSAVLLGAGAFSLMLKGFAWEEAITLVLLLLALLPARQEFRRETLPPSEQHASGWLIAIAVVLTTAFWLGLFSYRHLDDTQWWHFTLYDNAARFLRASVAVAIVALGATAFSLVRAARYRRMAALR